MLSANERYIVKCGSGTDGSSDMRTGHVIHHAIDRIDRIANRATDDFGFWKLIIGAVGLANNWSIGGRTSTC